MSEEGAGSAAAEARPALRRHGLAYAAVNGVLVVIDALTPGSWWFFWPLFGWGAALGFHYLYVRSLAVDQDWAEQRADDIRYRAYDLQHIKDIEERYKDLETPAPTSAKPPDEQPKR